MNRHTALAPMGAHVICLALGIALIFSGRAFCGSTIPLSQALPAGKTIENIRVKIFPHERKYVPHDADRDQSKFEILADEGTTCAAYEADGAQKRPIIRSNRLVLNAAKLKVSLRIKCDGAFALIRESGLRSFSYEGEVIVKIVPPTAGRDGGTSSLIAILNLSLEEYLRGVVPAEVMAAWPMETLKSQAVAARTYAVFHVSSARTNAPERLFDVDDTIAYQAFTGIDDRHERTDEALKQTRGEILVFNEQIIQAYYHADSGGFTASADAVFNDDAPYCKSKPEPYDPALVKSEWELELFVADFESKLRSRQLLSPGERISGVSINRPGLLKSGHVISVILELTSGERRAISTQDLKRTINLGSSKFWVVSDSASGKIRFQGRGNGHGVGLNQMGAKVLAESYQWSYQKILTHYYTGTVIRRLEVAQL